MSPRHTLSQKRRQRGSLLFYVLSILPIVVLGPIIYEQHARQALRKNEHRIAADQARLRLERRALFAQTLLLRGESYPGMECDEVICQLTLSEEAADQRDSNSYRLEVSYAVQEGYAMRSVFSSGTPTSVGIPASPSAPLRSYPAPVLSPTSPTETAPVRLAIFTRVWAGMVLLQGLVIAAFFAKDRKLRSGLPFS